MRSDDPILHPDLIRVPEPDVLGIVTEIQARRESIARLSPTARHQAFPTVYAKPVPRKLGGPSDAEMALRVEMLSLKARNTALAADVANLRRIVRAHRMTTVAPAEPLPPTVEAVMQAFCAALAKTGYRIRNDVMTVNDLRTPTNAWTHSHPRFVAIWLSKRLSRATHAFIGLRFGGRDHTTIGYALEKAASAMERVPAFKSAADEVLETFRAQGATP